MSRDDRRAVWGWHTHCVTRCLPSFRRGIAPHALCEKSPTLSARIAPCAFPVIVAIDKESTMPLRVIGIVLLVLGVILLGFGINAHDSVADSVKENFTGRYTDRTMGYLIG